MSRRSPLPDAVMVAGALASLAASTALLPLFHTASLLWYALAAVVLVLVATTVQRRVGVPAALVPLVSLACLVLAAAARFAQPAATALVLPSTATPDLLRAVVDDALADVRNQTLPAVATPGLMLLVFGGIGAVTVVVMTCVTALRRPALAGAPLAAVLIVPAVLQPGGSSWWVFLLGAAGYVNLLLSDQSDRISRWGQSLSAGTTRDRSPVGAGRRLGAAALGVAVLAPALLPGLDGGLLGFGGGNGPGDGKGTVVRTYNPIVSLRGQLIEPRPQPLLRFTTNVPDPAYLRMTTLDRFNGSTWFSTELSSTAQDRVDHGVPAPAGLESDVATTTVTSRIQVTGLSVPWLPLPYPATSLKIDGDWRYDRRAEVVWSPKTDTEGIDYRLTSLAVSPTTDELLSAGPPDDRLLSAYTKLPADVPMLVRSTADDITADQPTAYQKAVALQAYFRSGLFTYSLETKAGSGDDALSDFLVQRQGYCEQFAAAMAVMARLERIPSRVAIGFTPGVRQQDGSYLVTTADAHSWPELYFQGLGWLPFEPTPTGDGRAAPRPYTELAGVTPGVAPTTAPSAAPGATGASAAPSASVARGLADPTLAGPTGTVATEGMSSWVGWSLLALLIAALMLAIPWLARTTVSGRRRARWRAGSGPARVAPLWEQLVDDVQDAGLAVDEDRSPRQVAAAVRGQAELAVDAHHALDRLVAEEEQARYAATPTHGGSGWDDVHLVRESVLAGLGRARAVRARLLPVTALWRTVRAGTSRLSDLLDRLDEGWSRGGRAVLGLRRRRA